MTRRSALGWLPPGLALFWALYFTVVALSNLADVLRFLHVLPAEWRWVSGNLTFIATSTARLGPQPGLSALLLAGVVAWELGAAALFWRSLRLDRRTATLGAAFLVSLALWAVFIVLDEVLLIFETGAEATHVRLFTAELATLLVIRSIGEAGPAG